MCMYVSDRNTSTHPSGSKLHAGHQHIFTLPILITMSYNVDVCHVYRCMYMYIPSSNMQPNALYYVQTVFLYTYIASNMSNYVHSLQT